MVPDTDLDLPEMSLSFENPFKTKISKMHNFAANYLLKTVTVNMENLKQWAILDSGATSNFLMIDAHTVTIIPTDNPKSVTLSDGRKVQSTHKCTLDLPDLPIAARNGHIIPGLALNSLISTVVLCNAGCKVTFNKYGMTVNIMEKLSSERQNAARTGCG